MNQTEKLPKGVIKVTPECFVVQELVRHQREPIPLGTTTVVRGPSSNANVMRFNMTKRGYTTEDALHEVARQLCIPRHNISHYGMKDRHALTSQCIGVLGKFGGSFFHPNIVLTQTVPTHKPLQHGGNIGNRFDIVVISQEERVDISKIDNVLNYFGEQRFSSRDCHTVGRLLLEGKWSEALYAEINSRNNDPNRIRQAMSEERAMEFFFSVKYYHETKFRVLQWQSYLWNRLTSSLRTLPNSLPMWSPENASLYRDIWSPRYLDQDTLPLLHKFNRRTTFQPRNVEIQKQHACWRFQFDLSSGSYATVALSNLFALEDDSKKRR